MTMTAEPQTGTPTPRKHYRQDLRLPAHTVWWDQSDTSHHAGVFVWSYLKTVMSLTSQRIRIFADPDGELWADIGQAQQDAIDWHRLDDYRDHGYAVIARSGVTKDPALLEPISKDKLLDHIAEACMEVGVQRLGDAALPRYGRPVSKDWSVSKLLAHFDKERVMVEMRGDHLLLAWPDGKGPHTLDLRHGLDVLGDLLKAKVSGEPQRCHAVDGCPAPADTLLFLDTPVCANHADARYQPKVDAESVPWWEVMAKRSQAPQFMFTPDGVGVMGLAMPPDDARIRLYWKR